MALPFETYEAETYEAAAKGIAEDSGDVKIIGDILDLYVKAVSACSHELTSNKKGKTLEELRAELLIIAEKTRTKKALKKTRSSLESRLDSASQIQAKTQGGAQ